MIEVLEHSSHEVALQIHAVFQQSYRTEAELIGIQNFPPLLRAAEQIQNAGREFLGLRIDSELTAIVEYKLDGAQLSIDSLVVHPSFFRRGLASQLLRSLLDENEWQNADVETAVANRPAISLYRKFGFSKFKRWKTAEGIEKVQLLIQKLS